MHILPNKDSSCLNHKTRHVKQAFDNGEYFDLLWTEPIIDTTVHLKKCRIVIKSGK